MYRPFASLFGYLLFLFSDSSRVVWFLFVASDDEKGSFEILNFVSV